MSKIKVSAKNQNRVALGIVHAYMVMNPYASLEDIREAFPYNICPDCGVKELFVPLEVAESFNAKGMNLYFAKDNEPLVMGDGEKVCLASMWTKKSLQRAIEQAKNYEIEAEQSDYAERGSYQLEYLNGYVPVPKMRTPIQTIGYLLAAIISTDGEISDGENHSYVMVAKYLGIPTKVLFKCMVNALAFFKTLNQQEVITLAITHAKSVDADTDELFKILMSVIMIALSDRELNLSEVHNIMAIGEGLGIDRDIICLNLCYFAQGNTKLKIEI